MIKHIVLIRFPDEVSDAQREAIYQSVKNLKQYVTGWQGFVAGANVTPEVGMDKGYNGGFIIDFVDEVKTSDGSKLSESSPSEGCMFIVIDSLYGWVEEYLEV